ncbi:MAG: hypothetical protein DRG83_13900, partial [Deltaproteobacteria bacterium]
PLYISSAKERFQGYCKALEEYGVRVDPSMITTGAVTLEDGYQCTKSLLKRKPRPAAIFAFSDFVAFGVIRAIHESGLRVPSDIAVVGYDNNQFAPYAEVPLTTIHVPKEQLGIMSIKVLKDHLVSNQPVTQLKIPVDLVVRESTSKK